MAVMEDTVKKKTLSNRAEQEWNQLVGLHSGNQELVKALGNQKKWFIEQRTKNLQELEKNPALHANPRVANNTILFNQALGRAAISQVNQESSPSSDAEHTKIPPPQEETPISSSESTPQEPPVSQSSHSPEEPFTREDEKAAVESADAHVRSIPVQEPPSSENAERTTTPDSPEQTPPSAPSEPSAPPPQEKPVPTSQPLAPTQKSPAEPPAASEKPSASQIVSALPRRMTPSPAQKHSYSNTSHSAQPASPHDITITGSIKPAENLDEFIGASIEIESLAEHGNGIRTGFTVDSSGEILGFNLPEGEYKVIISSPGFEEVETEVNHKKFQLHITLHPHEGHHEHTHSHEHEENIIQGIVLDANRNPLAKMHVTIKQKKRDQPEKKEEKTEKKPTRIGTFLKRFQEDPTQLIPDIIQSSDKKGGFSTAGKTLTDGTYIIFVKDPGNIYTFYPKTIQVRHHSHHSTTVVGFTKDQIAKRLKNFSGKTVDISGNPLAGIMVTIKITPFQKPTAESEPPKQAVEDRVEKLVPTGGKGTFSTGMKDFPDGSYSITATSFKGNYMFLPQQGKIRGAQSIYKTLMGLTKEDLEREKKQREKEEQEREKKRQQNPSVIRQRLSTVKDKLANRLKIKRPSLPSPKTIPSPSAAVAQEEVNPIGLIRLPRSDAPRIFSPIRSFMRRSTFSPVDLANSTIGRAQSFVNNVRSTIQAVQQAIQAIQTIAEGAGALANPVTWVVIGFIALAIVLAVFAFVFLQLFHHPSDEQTAIMAKIAPPTSGSTTIAGLTMNKTGPTQINNCTSSTDTSCNIMYSITATYTGGGDVTIVDPIPANTTFVSATGNYTNGSGGISWRLKDNNTNFSSSSTSPPSSSGSYSFSVTVHPTQNDNYVVNKLQANQVGGGVSTDISACMFYRDPEPGAVYKSPVLLSYFQEAADKTGVPAALLAAFAQVESTATGFTDVSLANYDCHPNSAGAVGIMQVIPTSDTTGVAIGAKFLGTTASALTQADFCDIQKNIIIAAGVIISKAHQQTGDTSNSSTWTWDPSWNTNEDVIRKIAKGYYGSDTYQGMYSYGTDLWKSMSGCQVKTGSKTHPHDTPPSTTDPTVLINDIKKRFNISVQTGFSTQELSWMWEKLDDVSLTRLDNLTAGTTITPRPTTAVSCQGNIIPPEPASSTASFTCPCTSLTSHDAVIYFAHLPDQSTVNHVLMHELGHAIYYCNPDSESYSSEMAHAHDSPEGPIDNYGKDPGACGVEDSKLAYSEDYAEAVSFYLNPSTDTTETCSGNPDHLTTNPIANHPLHQQTAQKILDVY